MSLSNRILKIIEDNPTLGQNSTALLYGLYGEKVRDFKPSERRKIIAKIRTELTRLEQRKKIQRVARGHYKPMPLPHVIRKLENPEVKVHGLKIECNVAENNTLGVLPITPLNNTFCDWLDSRGFEPITGNRWNIEKWWDNHKITFTVNDKGLIEIFIKSSSNPLGFTDFVRFLEWLNGFFDPLVFKTNEMWVRQIGFNRDYRLIRLEGVSSVSLKMFQNVWVQGYQKGNVFRSEIHVNFPHMVVNLDSLVKSLMLITTEIANQNNGGNGHSNSDSNDKMKDEGLMYG